MKIHLIIFVFFIANAAHGKYVKRDSIYFDSAINLLKRYKDLKGDEKLVYSRKLTQYCFKFLKTENNPYNIEKKIDLINLVLYDNHYTTHELRGKVIGETLKNKNNIGDFNYFLIITSFCCYDDSFITSVMRDYPDTTDLKRVYIDYFHLLKECFDKNKHVEGLYFKYLIILWVKFPEEELKKKYHIT